MVREEIGTTAGVVWHHLNDSGPISVAKLKKDIGMTSDTVMLAVGWLAKEGKVSFVRKSNSLLVSLRQEQ